MSSTQKKPDNTKRAASGKASGKPAKRATAKSSSAKKGTSARKKPAAYAPDLVSRGIAAAVCIFLALLVALGMFGIHAVVPDLLKKGIQGLIGYGFWMVAFVLLWAAGLLLFLLGAFFRFSGLQRYRRDILLVSFVRLIVMPGILLTTAYLLGIRDTGFAGLISVFASATAIASFTMTQQMGGDSELAGDIVVATSALCIVTMFGWSLLFRQLGAF